MSNSTNATAPADFDPASLLPPYLNLPPHLSAHKYFFVCTLTVAAWDTLVLSPRTYRLFRVKERSFLKWAFFIIRLMMPIEFIIVAVAFFDIHITRSMCQRFFLFEPILTGILVSLCSAVHLVRIRAIYDKSNEITATLGILLLLQVVMMAVACGFYHVVPVDDPSQGCIAGPKQSWVGIYWVGATLFYTTTFALALARSFQSRAQKPLGLWKLMLRDGLNLYGAVWVVNMVNMLFWFIIKPTGPGDTIRTIVTSMAAVLTMTMTMRIILSIRGSLVNGGTFAGSSSGQSASGSSRSHSQGRSGVANNVSAQGHVYSINPASQVLQTYTLDDMRTKSQWEQADDGDGKSSLTGAQAIISDTKPETGFGHEDAVGVKVTVERDFE